jgi:DNA (cytosine-5)-methyltransferase 1
MARVFRAADLFCGAGGTSTGLMQALAGLDRRVELTAINHWPTAIETHAANHPEARHLCETLESVDPRKVVGGQLDLLVASPECTHHSRARGGKPMSDQSRATGWHVVRWAEALRPKAILVENVAELLTWGPLGANGTPLKSKAGTTFRAWFAAIESLGYTGEYRKLVAADHGAYTTRERLFVMFRLDGGRKRGALPWPAPTHAKAAGGLFPLPRWNAARDILDWSLPGRSIATLGLSEGTLRRIAEGARRYWGTDLEPFLMHLTHGGRVHDLDAPLPTITGANRGELALVTAGLEPFTLSQASGGAPRPTSKPLMTICTDGAVSLVQPFVLPYCSNGGQLARTTDQPLHTITTKDRLALVQGAHDGYRLDVRFRMLQPHELAAGMGFPAGYRFTGNKTEQVKQIGNAVEVNQARALCAAIIAAQDGRQERAA